MDTQTRREHILQSLEVDGYVKLSKLSDELGVSLMTIHRDLEYLAQEGAVRRVRGGARPADQPRHEIRTDYILRLHQEPRVKAVIAQHARTLVKDGATVFMDSSTTVLRLAQELERDPPTGLTIVTNAPAIAYHLQAPDIRVIVVPGDLDQSLKAITGTWTVEFLEGVRFSTAFFSAGGFSEEGGLMTQQRALADVVQAAIGRSQRRIALVDSSKFDTTALIPLAVQSEVDEVVTDGNVPGETIARYEEAGWRLNVAPLE